MEKNSHQFKNYQNIKRLLEISFSFFKSYPSSTNSFVKFNFHTFIFSSEDSEISSSCSS